MKSRLSKFFWKSLLEDRGYTVDIIEVGDAAPAFQVAATGDIDLSWIGMLPVTHGTLLEEFGDDVVDLDAWYDEAKLTIAVNEDAPITSLDELADNADLFDNKIIGIEPGAGLTETTIDSAMPPMV